MLTPATAFGYPVEPDTKTDSVGYGREPEQVGEKVVKERVCTFDSNKCGTNQGEF
jgi:hypothetical protein